MQNYSRLTLLPDWGFMMQLFGLMIERPKEATYHMKKISCQKAADTTLGKKNADGLYLMVLLIRIYFC